VGKAAVAAGVVGGVVVCTVAVLFLRRYWASLKASPSNAPRAPSSVITTLADNEIRSPEPVRVSSSFEVSATVSALHEQMPLADKDEESIEEATRAAAPAPHASPKRRL
jgi:hypothetical protein